MLRRQRFTRTGAAYLAAIALVTAAAFVSANNLLFLILAAMVSALLVSGIVGRLGLAELELDLLLPQHTSARRTVRGAVRVRNLKTWIPSFSVRLAFSRQPDGPAETTVYFPWIPGGATVEEPVDLYFPRRGAHSRREFQFITRFPFGFVERREDVAILHEVIVYPCLDPRPGFEQILVDVNAELAAPERGQGSDFYRIRPYQVTESARHVDWKATAHTGQPQVREFAREQEVTVTLVLDLDVPSQATDWLETAIECAAFLSSELVNRGQRVRLITQTADITAHNPESVYTILKYLALAVPAHGAVRGVPDDNTIQIVFTQNPERMPPNARLCPIEPDPAGGSAAGATGRRPAGGVRKD